MHTKATVAAILAALELDSVTITTDNMEKTFRY